MNSRAVGILLLLYVPCLLSFVSLCAVAQTNAILGDYQHAFTNAKESIETGSPLQFSFHYNPSTPGLNSFSATVVAEVGDNIIQCYATKPNGDAGVSVQFSPDAIVASDAQLRSVVSLPPIRLDDGGTTSGLPAELLITRVLTVLNAAPQIRSCAGKVKVKILSKNEKKQLSKALYPDGSGEGLLTQNIELRRTTNEGETKYELGSNENVYFEMKVSPCAKQKLDDLKKSYRWQTEVNNIVVKKMPKLHDWKIQLAQSGFEFEAEAACFTKFGPIAYSQVKDWDGIASQQVRLTNSEEPGTVVILAVSKCSLEASKRLEFVSDKNEKEIAVVGYFEDYPNGRILSLIGHDWLVSVSSNQPTRTRAEAKLLAECTRILVRESQPK